MAARTPCLRRCSTRSTTSPSQQGGEGTDSRSGLDDHRRISDTGHVYLLIGKDWYPSFIRRHILYLLATSYISLRNSWDGQPTTTLLFGNIPHHVKGK